MYAPQAIKSDKILTPQGVRPGYIIIRAGKIEAVLSSLPDAGIDVTDVTGNVVMPGLIDPHVHINEPGRTAWEGFETATRAAIAGGITTLVDMPLNASPVTTSVAALELKLYAATGQLNTDCGFWGGVIPGNAAEIEGLIANGVLGFKAFLTHSGIDDFPNVSEADLHQVMPILAKYHLPLLVHCELSTPLTGATGDPRVYRNYLQSRPRDWEDRAIELMIWLCELYGCRVHIVHLSSSDSLEQIRQAKARGLPITVETAQHYLYFDAAQIPDGATAFKCAPPIREKRNNELLWKALQDGIIDFVATDHSPAPPEMKGEDSGDFMKAWGGIASLQFALPILWTAAREHECSLAEVASWLSENPAKLIGLSHRKGKIEKGFDADLLVFDPDQEFVLNETMIHHKHTMTPYLGHTLRGLVLQTYLSGERVYDRGAFTPHRGKIITR